MTDNTKYRFFRKLKNKYRLVILNDGTFEERFVIKITPLFVLSASLVVGLILVVTALLLFSFTPLKEYVPGKTKLETQEEFLEMATKVDSLVLLIEGGQVYLDNLRTILSGGVVKGDKTNLLEDESGGVVNLGISLEDSLFRAMVEEKSSGDYISISSGVNNSFLSPLNGVLIDEYSKEKKHFGVDLISREGSIINSVSDGVVVTSDWTKETGFVIAIQHSEGFLSFYKHNSILLKDVGDYVKKGSAIAVIGNSGELSSGPHLHFELWKNGKSVDPENYISF